MPDIDYTVNIDSGFSVSFSNEPRKATGNKALANRFEITFLTTSRTYLEGGNNVTDSFGGDADKIVGNSSSLSSRQGIASSVNIAIDKTVESILGNQSDITDTTERLISASLVSLDVKGDTVYSKIELVPEKYEDSYPLYYSLPLRSI